MKTKFVLCKNCSNIINSKPLARCKASKFGDVVDGSERRQCIIERLDGIGRCGTLGNNFTPAKKVVVERKNPAKKINK